MMFLLNKYFKIKNQAVKTEKLLAKFIRFFFFSFYILRKINSNKKQACINTDFWKRKTNKVGLSFKSKQSILMYGIYGMSVGTNNKGKTH